MRERSIEVVATLEWNTDYEFEDSEAINKALADEDLRLVFDQSRDEWMLIEEDYSQD